MTRVADGNPPAVLHASGEVAPSQWGRFSWPSRVKLVNVLTISYLALIIIMNMGDECGDNPHGEVADPP